MVDMMLFFDKADVPSALKKLGEDAKHVAGSGIILVRGADEERLRRLGLELTPQGATQARAPSAPPAEPADRMPRPIGRLGPERPRVVRKPQPQLGVLAPSWTAPSLARFYEFPNPRAAAGRKVGIVLCGGGIDPRCLDGYYTALGLPRPHIQVKPVAGAENDPASMPELLAYMTAMTQQLGLPPPQLAPPVPPSTPADINPSGLRHPRAVSKSKELVEASERARWTLEGTMDVELLTGVAPGVEVIVYICDGSVHGYCSAFLEALHDGISVVSCSWGNDELSADADCLRYANAVLEHVTSQGVTVLAATGNAGAGDVEFPASSPYVLAVGGTSIESVQPPREVTWNESFSLAHMASAGGYSRVFEKPEWQRGVEGNMRGLPDVSANAAAHGATWVWLGAGPETPVGLNFIAMGTSASTPLWAGLLAIVGGETGRALGAVNAVLYENPSAMRDIVVGDNRTREDGPNYSAKPGWDACTGLGTPNGTLFQQLFPKTR